MFTYFEGRKGAKPQPKVRLHLLSLRGHGGWKRATTTVRCFVRLPYAWQFNLSAYMEDCVVRKRVLETTKCPSSSLSLDIN